MLQLNGRIYDINNSTIFMPPIELYLYICNSFSRDFLFVENFKSKKGIDSVSIGLNSMFDDKGGIPSRRGPKHQNGDF